MHPHQKMLNTSLQPFHISLQRTWCHFKLLRGLTFWGWWKLLYLPSIPAKKCHFFPKTEIPNLYNQVKAAVVKKKIAQGTWFAATTDLWTSESRGGQPYMSFTIHYLTPDWQLESNCLETVLPRRTYEHNNVLGADWSIAVLFTINQGYDHFTEQIGVSLHNTLLATTYSKIKQSIYCYMYYFSKSNCLLFI